MAKVGEKMRGPPRIILEVKFESTLIQIEDGVIIVIENDLQGTTKAEGSPSTEESMRSFDAIKKTR